MTIKIVQMKKVLTLIVVALFFSFSKGFAQGKDLRPLFEKYGILVKNQGSRGTCSIFTIVGLIEFERANVLNDNTPLSVEYLNWAANQIEGINADGSFFNYAIDGMAKYGICADDYMPYATRFTEKVEPSESAKKDAMSRRIGKQIWIKQWNLEKGITKEQLCEVQKQLDANHSVAIGFQWPKQGETIGEHGELAIVERENVFDGHSVLIVGYKADDKIPGGGYLIFKIHSENLLGIKDMDAFPMLMLCFMLMMQWHFI